MTEIVTLQFRLPAELVQVMKIYCGTGDKTRFGRGKLSHYLEYLIRKDIAEDRPELQEVLKEYEKRTSRPDSTANQTGSETVPKAE